MKIRLTKINKTSYKIELDGENIGVLSEKVIRSILDNIETETISDLQAEELFEKVMTKSWNALLNFIAVRERSEKECRDYLKRKFVNDNITGKLLKKAKSYKYLDDERFCRLYAESLFENGKSLNYIRHKLIEKGIDENLATNNLNELALQNSDRLDEIVRKTVKKYNSFPQSKQLEKTLNYLVRNGFEYYEIKEKVKNLIYKG